MSTLNIEFALTPEAKAAGVKTPSYKTEGAAAVDLYAVSTSWVGENTYKVKTGLHVSMGRSDLVGIVAIRSGCCEEYRLVNGIGIIDSDYQGEIILKINCRTDEAEKLIIGEPTRIAQLMFQPVVRPNLVERERPEDFKIKTSRGSGGFGSTGKH